MSKTVPFNFASVLSQHPLCPFCGLHLAPGAVSIIHNTVVCDSCAVRYLWPVEQIWQVIDILGPQHATSSKGLVFWTPSPPPSMTEPPCVSALWLHNRNAVPSTVPVPAKE